MASIDSVYPPEIWARESLMVLQNHNVMAPLVHRNFESEVAQYGDVVRTRRPDVFTAADLVNGVVNVQADHDSGTTSNTVPSGAMTVNSAQATGVSITLDKHKHVAFGITSRDQATSIKNLVEEFMEPAMIPLAEAVDLDILSAMTSSTLGLSGGSVQGAAASVNVGSGFDTAGLASVQKSLLDAKVPFAPVSGQSRVSMVLNTQHHSEIITQGAVIGADTSGLNPPPIRTGFVATLFGMNVYIDQQVPKDGQTDQSIAFHKNACALVTRPLEGVGGDYGVRSATMTKDGVGLRVMMSYEHRYAQWLVSLDILYGVAMLDARLGCTIKG
jgi:hypothetical protein